MREQLVQRIKRYIDNYDRMVEPSESAAVLLKDVLIYIQGDYLKKEKKK